MEKLDTLQKFSNTFANTKKFPVLFLGHGSPMNAIEENEFVNGFRNLSEHLEMPKAILCISAHWETKGSFVTAMENPRTIHDFGGFPKALYEVQYPAPGQPYLAGGIKNLVNKTQIELDLKWGLDHGAWSVIKHLYPKANVPVVQLSLDYSKKAQDHYSLAKELSVIRQKGVLIIGSGNIVHNLSLVAWDKLNESGYGYDWALEANDKMKSFILDGNHKELINYTAQGKEFQLAIPTPEHFIPLLYVLGMVDKKEPINIFNDKAVAGSLSMTSIKFGS
ncbi:MAG: 4,5-DOPA dioxygenase extradiol [Bacteroidales bacterium]|nr:4,5-DOPA dioxygenase extradiol [Bacteroidales bacterium]